jgi:hypothetical protein
MLVAVEKIEKGAVLKYIVKILVLLELSDCFVYIYDQDMDLLELNKGNANVAIRDIF